MDNKKLILLVEDNPDDEELMRLAFQENGMLNELIVRRDGEQALHYLLNASNPVPELVLLDLKLPKMDGLEVLKQLRNNKHTQFLPVVIMTSSKQEVDLINSYTLGCNSYIQKPVNFSQFIETVRQLGLYWMLLNIPAPQKR